MTCRLCKTDHPTIRGAPDDCVTSLSDRLFALENTDALLDRLHAVSEARDRARQPAPVVAPPAPPAEPPTLPPVPADTAG